MKILIKDVLLKGATRDIFINNGTVEEISERCTRDADKVINGSNKAALPSFINGHTHAAMTLFRGFADDMPLKNWLEEKIWVLESKLTEEDVYWGSKLACLEMIKNGVTAFNDMYWHWEGTARAAVEMGIRGLVSAV
ncbi:MAG: amidohydrolase family protein, partial [Syntrophorhabdaceae bacterium]|nr:amidohydrolase family protein [Syntrophorhabdaceae bacterium]